MDGQCLLPNTVLPSKFDGLNFDGLAGKRQNRQNFPLLKFPAIRYSFRKFFLNSPIILKIVPTFSQLFQQKAVLLVKPKQTY